MVMHMPAFLSLHSVLAAEEILIQADCIRSVVPCKVPTSLVPLRLVGMQEETEDPPPEGTAIQYVGGGEVIVLETMREIREQLQSLAARHSPQQV